jgi:acetoin utilization protein AcuB
MKSIPPIATYMVREVHTIGPKQALSRAHEMMRQHRIRHLPVLDGGKLIGIVSTGDLHLLETLRDVDPDEVLIEDAMTPDPWTVSPDTPLDIVVRTMGETKYGSTVIVDDAMRVIGIFTTTDACRVFAQVLEEEVEGAGETDETSARH